MHKSTNRNYTSRREAILHTIQIRVAENVSCIKLVESELKALNQMII